MCGLDAELHSLGYSVVNVDDGSLGHKAPDESKDNSEGTLLCVLVVENAELGVKEVRREGGFAEGDGVFKRKPGVGLVCEDVT